MRTIGAIIVSICLLSFVNPGKKKIQIYMAGDSTMSVYDTAKTPQRGWGQVFHEFFNSDVEIHDLARGGRSTKSYIAEGLWQKLIDNVQKDDWVFIEFGHNDHDKRKPERYTTPDEYKNNLVRMVKDVLAKGAHPVLLTPIAMRSFGKDGQYHDGHGVYPQYLRDAAKETDVPVIDLDKLFGDVIVQTGVDSSKSMFMNFGPGLYKAFPQGHTDNTHLRTAGAEKVASLVAAAIREKQLSPLAAKLLP